MDSQIRRFKLVLVGDAYVGKTTFVKRHQTGEFEKRYIATLGVNVVPLTFYTNKGVVILNVWDCAGQEKFAGLDDGYYIGADAFILFFGMDSKASYRNASHWLKKITDYTGRFDRSRPIIVCGTKCDLPNTRLMPSEMKDRALLEHPFYFISAKSNYNYEKPILAVIQNLMGPDTTFTETPSREPEPEPERVLPTPRSP